MKVPLAYSVLFINLISFINANKFEYLNGLSESDDCLLSENPNVIGKCEKIVNCHHEFERYRRNESVLKICEFNKNPRENVICCPQITSNEIVPIHEEEISLNLDTCRERYLSLRKSKKSALDLVYEVLNGTRKINERDCKNIHLYGKPDHDCVDNKLISFYPGLIFGGNETKLGDWQNMAAIGWTQRNREVVYSCGGIIISDKFILTAAHCRFRGKFPDTVRVGDRYLDKSDDDDHSQQLSIEKFIPHPEYSGIEAYNDIAVIKTIENILFNEFIAPACIGDIDDDKQYRNWKVAGYGQTELTEQSSSNILLEISVYNIQNSFCNESYSDHPRIPNGVLSSQICTLGTKDSAGVISDSCLGDSGSPIQYKEFYEVKDKHYDRRKMKTVYEIPIVVGLVSFGISCGLEIPSVNTKILPYVDWIESEMRK